MSNREIFYGAAIQGEKTRGDRANIHLAIMQFIKDQGFNIVSSHTSGKTREETNDLLEEAFGSLPPTGQERMVIVRGKMIEGVEGDIAAAIFEVSTPSLGTGIEIAHTYLRPRMGLTQIPILFLYQKDHWPNNLSTMIKGIPQEEFPNVQLREYKDLSEARTHVAGFLSTL